MRESTTAVQTTGDHADHTAMLQRVLNAVESSKRRGMLELAVAVALSLATLSSTWCAYQSQLWGGASSDARAAGDTAERQAAEQTIVALQIRTQDGLMLLEYWRALRQKDEQTATTLFDHMHPTLRKSVEASIAAGILKDPTVAGPLHRPEYALPEEDAAKRERSNASQFSRRASECGKQQSGYVILTLMFASVLFFGGISGTFADRRVRTALACLSIALFVFSFSRLLMLPPYSDSAAPSVDAAPQVVLPTS